MPRSSRQLALFSALPTSSLLSRLSPLLLLLLLLLLPSACVSQSIVARGFLPASEPDMVASGSVIETLQVTTQGECAARAIYRNSLGFNLQRQPDADGKRSCQPTNTVAGCFSVNMEQRAGWDYYFSGREGQNEPITKRTTGHTVTTYTASPGSYPPELSTADPDYRWAADCNGVATHTPEKQCSRYVMTGIYNDGGRVDDLDYVRCYAYGNKFRVSQKDAEVVPVELTSGVSTRLCPDNHVVSALADPDGAWYENTDWMKCNLLMSNWRVNYKDCYTTNPQSSGGGRAGWSDAWHIGTDHYQVYGMIGLWRTGTLFTGYRACRLYRMA